MKKESMLDMLYHGDLDNLISAKPDDYEYDEMTRHYSLASEDFEKTLSSEQRELHGDLQDEYTDICSIEREHAFKLGFKIAVGLLVKSCNN